MVVIFSSRNPSEDDPIFSESSRPQLLGRQLLPVTTLMALALKQNHLGSAAGPQIIS